MYKFSIIIPTYNRTERLKNCLDSLTRINYPRENFEVIIVDDGSNHPLHILVSSYEHEFDISLIRQTNSGPAKARNAGANLAKGQYLAFTDDDCTLDPNWFSALENAFSKQPNTLLGGKTINGLPNNPYSTASQLLIDYIYDYYNINFSQAQFFASNNFAVSRELFNQVGQFDINFPLAAAEDREFCDRWLFHGYSLYYVPQAIIYHSHDLNLTKFWRQHFNYGCGAFYFHQIRSRRNQTSLKFEPLRFYLQLLAYPFTTKYQIISKILISGLLFISQLANIGGFLRTKLPNF
ncbi:glycosyltransferase family 2 protein [Anabaena cylindrica FACHB-243]|uniref:Glycosyl transferase family 2 n=1 Tax=Anabaena cylindrica (strain ATCC 27899 / PCC 7122) TaxID=272123 RepID=K9ZIN2_ANACC|nr:MULTISPECIES: glycosyltransferase family A protein [Anabaena]AFZ59061.1 glycosyl transferase family 2 [Anabaena cylindrica PCC 7122]MBD2420600.1 glycosyltransferase family 2 protein [Anabaena cylindrica FACHB-243]MBY5282351.1 glycosyltransferase family 2 protein [Anabaena sp. CCAP 1446/1C]MBY5309238.1 glycosyltransferase family 2 protein [Anabaena sp. CCAP 1446/1C]MCM2408558.1 glycosyltransferase family 2 protein [Anabaena sp. CCAP 1446/1C]